MEEMPMWCPPTPPQDRNDIYIDYSLAFLYDTSAVMDDTQLPAVYVRKEYKRMRTDDGFYMDGRRPLKIRKDDGYIPPRSLFDRPSPALAKMRKDLKQQRNRGLIRSMPMANIKQQIPIKPLIEPEGMAEWLIFEDRAILNVIQNLQGLPLNLMLISPGHTPNWDLVADIVNQTSRTYRSPKQCRWRYEAVIVPREEGKLIDSPKKQKKSKNLLKTAMKNSRTPRTAQLYQNDNNNSFIKLTKMKFDAIKTAMVKKQPQLKKYMSNTPLNQKHLSVLSEMGIVNYDLPPSATDIAHRCFERLIQDRNLAQQKMEQQVKLQTKPPQIGTTQLMADQMSPMQMQQQHSSFIAQSSPQSQMSSMQQATIVVQPGATGHVSGNLQQQGQQSITALVHGSLFQGQRIQTQTINLTQSQANSQQQQIMKAIVASPGGDHQQTTLLTGIIQQLNPQQMQNSSSNLMQTSSVSVVLTSPPSTVTSVQPQIVSIQPTIATSTPIATHQQVGSLVQTINQQGQQVQVVSMSQLAIGSTSLTAQGANISGQQQIRQRSVSKDFVFQQRQGTQNPTVISLSGITGPGLQQLQNATLRLAPNFTNQPNIRTTSSDNKQQVVTQGPKRYELVTTGTSQIHIVGQPQGRSKIRFLHAGQIGQAGTAQTTLVPSSGVGQTVQVQSGQKITVATLNPGAGTSQQGVQQVVGSSDGVDTSQPSSSGSVTVQVGPQQRAQFIKQGQSIGQNPNQKLVMVKHELPQQYKTGQLQLTTQTQLAYAPAGNLQLQQASGSTSGGQQITTLIKTSGITTVAGGGQIGMKLSPVRAGIGQNQTVRQVAIPQTMTMGIQGARKQAPKVARLAQVSTRGGLILHQKDEGKFTLQEVKPIKASSNQIFLSNPGVIPVSVSQATNSRGETLQFVTPASRGIPSNNIRFQQIKMMPGNETPTILSQVITQRRLQTVQVQKPQQNVQQQMTIDANASSSSSQQQQQQVQLQTSSSPSQQTVTQPQHSPQQK